MSHNGDLDIFVEKLLESVAPREVDATIYLSHEMVAFDIQKSNPRVRLYQVIQLESTISILVTGFWRIYNITIRLRTESNPNDKFSVHFGRNVVAIRILSLMVHRLFSLRDNGV